jgi:hypothetical protein
MADLTAERLPALYAYRLPGVNLGDDKIYPNYSGNSILNIPSSICRLLEVSGLGAPPLETALLDPLGTEVRRVVLVLMDALALHRLQGWMAAGLAPAWEKLSQQGLLAPLTSITPSTTCSALTSLWTGRSPYEHGVMGYEMWMKEYGMIVNMILHSPAAFNGSAGSLEKAGFQPKNYLSFPTLAQHLAAQGIETHAFQHFSISGSGLSQMILNGARIHPFGSAPELWISVRQLLEAQPEQRMYTWVYWGNVDHLGHLHGPDDERPAAEFANFSQAFAANFLDKLTPRARRGTVIILLADHGMITTPPDAHYELHNHASLDRRLHMVPTGENRLMYLYPRPGQIEAVREYIQRTWLDSFRVVDSAYAAESGLFGGGERHPALGDRLGDLVVFPGEKMYLWWAPHKNILHGRHGGLNPEEMLVPFLAARLD